MHPYSGLIITYNEAHNIGACIASLAQVCRDIVVVDSGSSDVTVELARAAGAKVLVQVPFLGDGPQRSLGLKHCRHDWVINLDADERLEADLVATLKANAEWLVDALECRRSICRCTGSGPGTSGPCGAGWRRTPPASTSSTPIRRPTPG